MPHRRQPPDWGNPSRVVSPRPPALHLQSPAPSSPPLSPSSIFSSPRVRDTSPAKPASPLAPAPARTCNAADCRPHVFPLPSSGLPQPRAIALAAAALRGRPPPLGRRALQLLLLRPASSPAAHRIRRSSSSRGGSSRAAVAARPSAAAIDERVVCVLGQHCWCSSSRHVVFVRIRQSCPFACGRVRFAAGSAAAWRGWRPRQELPRPARLCT